MPWMPWWKKKKIAEMRLEFIERGRVEYMELENKRLCIKEEKINLAKMKEEREKIKEEETIRLAIMKEERERMKDERGKGKTERGEGNYDNECRCVASNATRIFS
jgi:hypothetical protein